MNISHITHSLSTSPSYIEWHTNHADAYLSSILFMRKEQEETITAHYYVPSNDTITTFNITQHHINLEQENQPILKKEHTTINPLNLHNVVITPQQAIQAATHHLKITYPREKPTTTIAILQHGDKEVWNVSIITSSMHILRTTIDAASGTITAQELENLMTFKKK